MFKVVILLTGIFLNQPFTGWINSEPVFTSVQDCKEFLMTEDSDNQIKVIIEGFKSHGVSEIKITSKDCVAKDQGA